MANRSSSSVYIPTAPSMSPTTSAMSTRQDDGFTLLELMVVIGIMAVLIAIAIPSFLGFRKSAQDRATQASLITAEKAARWIELRDGEFPSTSDSVTLLNTLEPAFTWVDHKVASTGPSVISVDEDNGKTDLNFAVLSDSGTCFYLRVVVGQPASIRSLDTSASECTSHDFQDEPGSGW